MKSTSVLVPPWAWSSLAPKTAACPVQGGWVGLLLIGHLRGRHSGHACHHPGSGAHRRCRLPAACCPSGAARHLQPRRPGQRAPGGTHRRPVPHDGARAGAPAGGVAARCRQGAGGALLLERPSGRTPLWQLQLHVARTTPPWMKPASSHLIRCAPCASAPAPPARAGGAGRQHPGPGRPGPGHPQVGHRGLHPAVPPAGAHAVPGAADPGAWPPPRGRRAGLDTAFGCHLALCLCCLFFAPLACLLRPRALTRRPAPRPRAHRARPSCASPWSRPAPATCPHWWRGCACCTTPTPWCRWRCRRRASTCCAPQARGGGERPGGPWRRCCCVGRDRARRGMPPGEGVEAPGSPRAVRCVVFVMALHPLHGCADVHSRPAGTRCCTAAPGPLTRRGAQPGACILRACSTPFLRSKS